MPEFYKFFVETAITGLLGFAVWFLQRIASTNLELTKQVSALIEQTKGHGRELKHQDGRITRLEDRRERRGSGLNDYQI